MCDLELPYFNESYFPSASVEQGHFLLKISGKPRNKLGIKENAKGIAEFSSGLIMIMSVCWA
jgi:hypothetical protein